MRKLIAEGEIVMDLIKENENLIHCLKELRDELKIEELEKAIRNQEFNDTSYEELIYNGKFTLRHYLYGFSFK